MAVFQQIIIDEVPGTPGGSLHTEVVKNKANKGYLLTLATSQTDKNKDAFGSAVYRIPDSSAQIIYGILCDYHNPRQISVGTKGRFYVATSRAVTAADLGKGIDPSSASGSDPDVGKARASTLASAVGEIVGYGTQTGGDDPIGDYAIVDLNLP